jgi:hypothetical protein
MVRQTTGNRGRMGNGSQGPANLIDIARVLTYVLSEWQSNLPAESGRQACGRIDENPNVQGGPHEAWL